MSKSKKTKKVEEVKIEDNTQELEGTISLSQEKYEECEWCFQFDEDDVQVFAWTDDNSSANEDPKVIFTVTNSKGSYITFSNKEGKTFKIFARELTNEGRILRQQQKELAINMKNQLENGSENKETQS